MATLHRGIVVRQTGNPFYEEGTLDIIEQGGLLIDETGRLQAVGEGHQLASTAPDASVIDHGKAWLIPGFIDGHIHFPQFYATASPGDQLLDWLSQSIFPAEMAYRDPSYAREAARAFVAHLLKNGTTTALAFGSQYLHATRALFEEAEAAGLRLIAGQTLMDRDAPKELFTPPKQAFDEACELIEWTSDKPFQHYAVTPRFALSCSSELMEVCHQLRKSYPDVWLQTHINENHAEIEAVRQLYPEAAHYLDVYDSFGLLGPRSVLAHNIHPTEPELAIMSEKQLTVCHCPCSNHYLGSGHFPMQRHIAAHIPIMMGSDIGAGGNFTILREMAEAYKVQQMKRYKLDASRLLFLATLGGAQGLGLDEETGSLEAGKSADFLVLDPGENTYLARRLEHGKSLEDQLFVLLNQADDRHIAATYLAGQARARNGS